MRNLTSPSTVTLSCYLRFLRFLVTSFRRNDLVLGGGNTRTPVISTGDSKGTGISEKPLQLRGAEKSFRKIMRNIYYQVYHFSLKRRGGDISHTYHREESFPAFRPPHSSSFRTARRACEKSYVPADSDTFRCCLRFLVASLTRNDGTSGRHSLPRHFGWWKQGVGIFIKSLQLRGTEKSFRKVRLNVCCQVYYFSLKRRVESFF